MTTIRLYGLGLALAGGLACGDSGNDRATARPSESGARRTARAPIDVCALLTKAEAEAILGRPVAPAQGAVSQCTYAAEAGRGEIMLHVLPLEFGSEGEFHAFLVEDTERMNARLKKSLGDQVKETKVEKVPQVGSPAYFVDPTLVVLKDGRVLSILAAGQEQALQVAAKAVPRF